MKLPIQLPAKKRQSKLPWRAICLLLLGLVGCRLALPVLTILGQQTAMLAAAVTLPQGSVQLLRDRFMGEVDEPSHQPPPSSSQQDSSKEQEEPSSSESQSESQSSKEDPPPTTKPPQPSIPKAYTGTLLHENMAGKAGSSTWLGLGTGYLRNYTKLTADKIITAIEKAPPVPIATLDKPTVLIVHTHATESYEEYDSLFYDTRNTWRSTDNTKNMVAVGTAIAKALEEQGIQVIHDETQHDYPSYNGSYDNSRQTIAKWLKKYPSISIVLDVHRDAIQRDKTTTVKPVTTIDGKQAAQMMIIAGSDDGTMNMPNWKSNLRFAADLTNQIEADYPTLTRPIFFCYRKYNMDMTPGSLLLEFGASANTLEEAVYAGQLVGTSLGKLITDMATSK